MNPDVLSAINLINSVFTANGNQEITGTNSNTTLLAIVNALYGITGDPEYLNTDAKDNLVDAINELKDLLGQITSIKVYSGDDDPNTFDVNGGEYYTADFYSQTDPNVGTIALWIYTGVDGIEWLNLTSKEVDFVASLPSTGLNRKLYIRTSDNTQWRWQLGGSVQYPVATWVQINAIHVHRFTYDGTNATQTLTHPLNAVIDLQIEQGCNFDDYIEPFTVGGNQFTVKSNFLSVGNKLKLIYK